MLPSFPQKLAELPRKQALGQPAGRGGTPGMMRHAGSAKGKGHQGYLTYVERGQEARLEGESVKK